MKKTYTIFSLKNSMTNLTSHFKDHRYHLVSSFPLPFYANISLLSLLPKKNNYLIIFSLALYILNIKTNFITNFLLMHYEPLAYCFILSLSYFLVQKVYFKTQKKYVSFLSLKFKLISLHIFILFSISLGLYFSESWILGMVTEYRIGSYIFILVVFIYFYSKILMDINFKSLVLVVSSFFILRSILILLMQIFLPESISNIGVDILQISLFSTFFCDFFNWLVPVYQLDSFSLQEKMISLRDLNRAEIVIGIIPNDFQGWNVYNMKLNPNQIKSLCFIYERAIYDNSIVTIISPKEGHFYPVPYNSIIPESGELFPRFPNSNPYSIPLFKNTGVFKELTSLGINASSYWNIRSPFYILYDISYEKDGQMEMCNSCYALIRDIKPAVVNDWTTNKFIYIKMDEINYIEYDPYNITTAMLNKPIYLKTGEGEYIETLVKVHKLYKPSEINYANSSFSPFFKSTLNSIGSLTNNCLSDYLTVQSSMRNSPILRSIKFDDLDWNQINLD